MIPTKAKRRTLGYVVGFGGTFGRTPFYQLTLQKPALELFQQLLGKSSVAGRSTVTITASYHQPDRLRITEAAPPDYEARAARDYVRGDAMRVNGREGVSCGIDLTSQSGVPALLDALRKAASRAQSDVTLKVVSRKRDVVEIIPDTDLPAATDDVLVAGSLAAAAVVLHPEDFSDWEV